MTKYKDMTGKKFGRLTVVEYAGNDKQGIALWKCKCDCGNETIVYGTSLRSGKTQSCGCLGREKLEIGKRRTTHGQSGTRLHTIWKDMKQRCNNPNSTNYNRYGDRNISVCDEWSEFENFYAWAMSSGYDDSLSIDRIDNDKGYEPTNCRWSTLEEQATNKRNTVKIHETPLANIAKSTGAKYTTLLNRKKSGWSDDDILKVPIGDAANKKQVKRILYNGTYYRVKDIARIKGVSPGTVYRKLRLGITGEELFIDTRKKEVSND